MKTTINIPDEKISALLEATRAKTRTEAIETAVSEYIRRSRLDQLMALAGTCEDVMSPNELRASRSDAES